MGKGNRGSRRPANQGANNNGRRGSLSEVSEGNSEPSSPAPTATTTTTMRNGKLESHATKKAPATENEYEKKKQTFITRTIWTFLMIALFFAAMFAGHIYLVALVAAVQIVSFKEVIAIANVPSRARRLRFTKSLNWYFLASTMYFLYGESVIYYFKHILLVDRVFSPLATHHRFISFTLYIMGSAWSIPPQFIRIARLVN